MDLIPRPRRITAYSTEDGFTLRPGTVLDVGPGAERAGRWVRSVLGAATGLEFPAGEPGRDGAVRLAVDATVPGGPEAYRITVDPQWGVRVTGAGPAGVFWGAQTLRQLLGPEAFRRAPTAPDRRRRVPAG